MSTLINGTLINDLIETVEKVQTSASGPEFTHEHTCSECGSICLCDWEGCDPNQDGICQACADWKDGRA